MTDYTNIILDDRYEILNRIGSGGMADVYRAKDTKLNRYVAVKILRDEILRDTELRERFQHEAEAVATLSHPNIVSIFDISIGRNIEYFVMEMIDGITLREYMNQRGIFSEKETISFVLQILRALEHAHSRGVIHRDIKPQNVMMDRDGILKVTDFGIAYRSNDHVKDSEGALGSVYYIAPEQARGETCDARTDIYSLGVIMFEMLTGELPFSGDNPVAVALQHITAAPPAPSSQNRQVTPGMDSIVLKTIATDPAQRYSSAAAMIDELEAYCANPLIPVGLYKGSGYTGSGEGEDAPTKIVDGIGVSASGQYQATPPTRLRRQKARYKYNEKMPIIAGVLATFLFLLAACVVFVSTLKGCSEDSGESFSLPNFVGEDYESLVKELASSEEYQFLKIKLGEEDYDDTAEEGIIISQNPEAGSLVKSNSTVTVNVSLGIREINMIALVGLDSLEAQNKLSTLLIQNKIENVNISVESETSETVPAGQIIRTEPESGTAIRSGDEVLLVCSLGPEKEEIVMPDLYGCSLAQAVMELTERNIEFDRVVEEYDETESGTVIGQSIEAETILEEGQKVDLIVSRGPRSTETREKESETETAPESESEAITEPETEPVTEEETQAETESESDPVPAEGTAVWTFSPATLEGEFSGEDIFELRITANGETVWTGESMTILSDTVQVFVPGTVGESCTFVCYVRTEEEGESEAPCASAVVAFE